MVRACIKSGKKGGRTRERAKVTRSSFEIEMEKKHAAPKYRMGRFLKRGSTVAADAMRFIRVREEADRVVRQMYYVRGQLVEWFNKLDDNGDAVLTVDELAGGLEESFSVSPEDCVGVASIILARADEDQDGTLSRSARTSTLRRHFTLRWYFVRRPFRAMGGGLPLEHER